MNMPPGNSQDPNPVRGFLLIGMSLANTNLLFVFRRREQVKALASVLRPRIVGGLKTSKPAPPKNKKGEFRAVVVAISRQPLTGFGRLSSKMALSKHWQ
jgi:hypothetical protein